VWYDHTHINGDFYMGFVDYFVFIGTTDVHCLLACLTFFLSTIDWEVLNGRMSVNNELGKKQSWPI
jgi:hypothetical protein